MAIVDGFTTLAAVKLEAGIIDTSQDSLLEALISSTSAAMKMYLGREVIRTTHTDEKYSVNSCQFLYLKEYPIQTVTAVTLAGSNQRVNVDYFLAVEDKTAGRLYRPNGWTGTYYTRGTFPDIYAGARDITVTYAAGWYLPADALYVAGSTLSLPVSLSYACNRAVISRYRTILNNADGIKQYSEGGISTTFMEVLNQSGGGFDDTVCAMLNPFKRREAA
jgi:hypothetical protein